MLSDKKTNSKADIELSKKSFGKIASCYKIQEFALVAISELKMH